MSKTATTHYSAAPVAWGRHSHYRGSEYEEQELKDEELQNDSKMPYFRVFLLATILEDIITELRILDACNAELKVKKILSDMGHLLAKKHHIEEKPEKDELDGVDPKRLDCVEYILNKLQADREFILHVLTDTYLSLTKSKEFHKLSESILVYDERRERLNELMAEEIKNKQVLRDFIRQIRQQRNNFKSVTYDKNNAIDIIKSSLQDAEANAATRSRYAEGWQRARVEQHEQRILDNETRPADNIELYKKKIEQEQRVHSEVELLFTVKIQEIMEKVEQWMKKYDADMEVIDLKIQRTRNLHERTRERRLELEKTLVEHEELASNWVSFKREREAARLWRETMHKSAIIIQAWWRGLLVRNQLGPYKVRLNKKRAPKDQGNKKK